MDPNSVLSSTFYDKRWSSNQLMRSYELEYEDGSIEERIDYSDWRFTSLIKRLRNFTPYRYNGFEKFTTIVYKNYGTTTVYRIILAFNGYMHPYEIDRGAIIKLPDALELSAELDKLIDKKQSSQGRSVVI